MKGIQKAIGNEGIERFLPPTAPEKGITETETPDFPVCPVHPIGQALNPREEDIRICHSALRQEFTLGSTEIAFDTDISRGCPDQLFTSSLQFAV